MLFSRFVKQNYWNALKNYWKSINSYHIKSVNEPNEIVLKISILVCWTERFALFLDQL